MSKNKKHVEPSLGGAVTMPSSPSDMGNADTMLAAQTPTPLPSAPVDATSKRYEIEGELARGGLGRILKAQDKRLHRPVAIKQLLQKNRGYARFEYEALTTAKLQHPAIVPVYEAGVWEDGEPYFAMKLVSGQPFDEVIRSTKTLDERLVLLPRVIDICEAMAYAHSKGIIHRDLKPQNVLLGEFGETVVIDWGLAKDIGNGEQGRGNRKNPEAGEKGMRSGLADEDIEPASSADPCSPFPELTQVGAVMGTPSYMPPEQAKALPVDARADVYALGAILYHLLSGQAPYQGKSSIEVLKELSNNPPAPLAKLQQGIPPDLLTLVDKAMSRSPEHRYPSAKELAQELRRFQNGQLVLSHHYGGWQRLRRFVMRNKLAMVVGLVSAVIIAIGEVFLFQTNNELKASKLALQRENEKTKQFMLEKTKQSEVLRLGMVNQTVRLAKEQLSHDPRATLTTLLDAWKPEMQELTEAQWSIVHHIATEALALPLPRSITRHEGLVFAAVFSMDGSLIASGDANGIIRVTPLSGGKSQELVTEERAAANSVQFSLDGTHLFSTSYQGPLRRWDLSTSQGQVLHQGRHVSFVLPPAQDVLAAVMVGGEVLLIDPKSGKEEQRFPESRGANYSLAFSPDSSSLALGSTDGHIFHWEYATGEITRLSGHSTETKALIFSQRALFTADSKGEIRSWNLETGEGRLFGQTTPDIEELSLSSNGRWLAASVGINLWVWDLTQASTTPVILQGHRAMITEISPDPKAERFATADEEGALRLWDLPSRSSTSFLAHTRPLWNASFSLNGKQLLSAGYDGEVLLWSPKPPNPLIREPLRGKQLSRDTSAVILGEEEALYFYDRAKGQLGEILNEELTAYQISPNNAWVAAATESKRLIFYDTQRRLSQDLPIRSSVTKLAFSLDSRYLIYAEDTGALFLWDIEAKSAEPLFNENKKIGAIATSLSSGMIAVGDYSGSVYLIDIKAGSLQKKFTAPFGVVRGLAFSPDGGELAVGSSDGKIRFYQTSLGEEQAPEELIAHETLIAELEYSPNAEALLSIDFNRNAKLWLLEGATKRQEAKGRLIGEKIASGRFSPDSKKVYLLNQQGALIEEKNDVPRDTQELRALIQERLSGS